jgi:hypothetical protein
MASKKKSQAEAPATTSQDTKLYVLGDDAIAMIREVLQLTLYTGTNIIDHLRAMRLEEVPSHPGKLVPNEAYVAAYNEMVAAFAKRAQEMADEARKNAAREVAETTTTIQ